MTPQQQHIQALYREARDLSERDPIWETLRQAEAAEMPNCVNHPGRPSFGGFEGSLCEDCAAREITRRRLWLKSFSLVQGGLEALR